MHVIVVLMQSSSIVSSVVDLESGTIGQDKSNADNEGY
jgi:hypothetical protein